MGYLKDSQLLFSLPLEDEIFDEEKGIRRIIRYIPGEQSIYKDEQSSDEKIAKKIFYLQFSSSGEVVIDGRDRQKLEFMLKSNFNGNNMKRDFSKKPKYWLVDLGQGVAGMMETERASTKAKSWCFEGPWEDIKAYSRVMKIDVNRDPNEVRWSLSIIAAKDPAKFLEGLGNDLTERKHIIMSALDRGILKINTTTNTISWTDGGVICLSPLGKDIIDHFTDVSFSPDGERTLAAIRTMLDKGNPKKYSVDIPSELADLPPKKTIENKEIMDEIQEHINDADLEVLITQAIEKGILQRKSPAWFVYEGRSFGSKRMKQDIKENPILISKIRESVKNAK